MDESDEQTRPHAKRDRVHETEERFRALTEHFADPISEISQDRRVVYVSPSFTKTFGYEPEEVIGKDAMLHVHPEDLARMKAVHSTARVDEAVAQLRFRYRHKNGSWRWVELTGCPYVSSSGEIRAILVNRDVTDRVEAARELQAQLESERRIAELSRYFLTVGTDDFEAGIERGLRAASELAGADRAQFFAIDRQSRTIGKYFHWSAEGVERREPKYSREMLAQYRWSAAKILRGEVIAVPRVSDLPPEAAVERESLIGEGVKSYLAIPIRHGDTALGCLDFFCMRSERRWSDQELTRFGLLADVFASALRRHRAETSRRESERRFWTLAEHASDSICELAADGSILYASPSFPEVCGYTLDEMLAIDPLTLVHPDDRESIRTASIETLIAERRTATVRSRVRHRDGGWRWLESTARPFRTPSGEDRVAVVIRDVTSRQEAQVELERRLDLETRVAALSRRFLSAGSNEIDQTIRESLAELTALADTDRSWLLSFDRRTGDVLDIFEWRSENVPSQEGDLAKADPHGFRWTERQLFRGQVVQISDRADLPPEAEAERRSLERRGVRSLLGIPLNSGDSPIGFLGFETVDRRKSWPPETITLLRLAGEIFATALQRKAIEENLRESQQQLMQAQKMEALGTLGGGIAHDFNNQLTVMLGNARYVLSQVEDDPDLKDALTDLNRAAEHCAQLTRSLLAFSRRNAPSPRSLDVSEVAAEAQELLRPLIPNSIDFEVAPPAGVDWVKADPTQLQQVLVNLAVNARDAMPNGGRLVITTQNRTVDADAAARLGLPEPGAYVELGVIDTGEGMDEATKMRIFEPFFTTKPLGKGTGLGLATAYAIVKESGGAIEVDTAVGSGTTFRVLLPSSSQPASADGVEAEPSAPIRPGTVLVVEDESAVGRFIQRALKRQGFEILEATDGPEALQLMESHPGRVDAVVTDVDMPQMNGVELARELARCHPETPVLFLSGSSPDFLDDLDPQEALGSFLQKPFTEEAIAEELRRLIAAARSR